MMRKPFTILICALGGEGGGVLTDWLVNAAKIAKAHVQATSIPGVAQRTGATTYYIELMEPISTQVVGINPIFGLSPVPGQIDLLISSELLETGRQISNGMSNPEQTCVISASNRTLTTLERMGLGDSRVPEHSLIELIQQFSKSHHIVDMGLLAKQSGTIISSVMLGCIGASRLLPFKREDYESAIKGANEVLSAAQIASLKGFSQGWDAVEKQTKNTQFVDKLIQSIDAQSASKNNEHFKLNHIQPDLSDFPVETHEILNLGYSRLIEYQNKDYAELYLKRIKSVYAAEKKATQSTINTLSNNPLNHWNITNESARWTALWMAFDDIVRVAQLKIKQNRFEQIKKDVNAKSDEIIRVYDHFKPGVPELAGLLPKRIGDLILKWEEKRIKNGRSPLELKIKLITTSISGTLILKLLSNLKWLRKLGRRYHFEQLGINSWLNCVIQSTMEDIALGQEVAACGRLIKGYGSTNLRAHENLNYILDSLTNGQIVSPTLTKAEIVKQARQNALKDESGKPLDAFMRGIGAPTRPLKEQPIRWMKRPTSVAPS